MPSPRSLNAAQRTPAVLRHIFICLSLAYCLSPLPPTCAAQSDEPVSALRLWRELAPVADKDEARARAQAAQDTEAARALYRELLFDAVDARLYDGQPIAPQAARVRTLLASFAADGATLEAKFNAWTKDDAHTAGVGFAADSTGFEELLYRYIAAEQKNVARWNEKHEASPVTARGLTERALTLAGELHVELAMASCASNLALYAGGERRRDDMLPHIERAAAIWQRWQHPAGLVAAAYLRGEYHALGQQWPAAATDYRRAADQAAAAPGLRQFRVVALDNLAWSLRNAGDARGVVEVLTTKLAEQEQLLKDATDDDKRHKLSKDFADAQIALGEALAAVGQHAAAGDRYAQADRLRADYYQAEQGKLEADIVEMERKLQAALVNPQYDEAQRAIRASAYRTVISSYLGLLSTAADARHDRATLVKLAARDVATARAGQDSDQITHALNGLAKAHLANGDLTAARASAQEAFNVCAATPRRAWLYQSVEILASIAEAADDTTEAAARYRQVLELTQPDALPPPYDLAAESDAGIRAVRARMNNFERTTRFSSALEARRTLATLQQDNGNYSAADEAYAAVLRDLPKLYAMGAPDEAELLRWLDTPAPDKLVRPTDLAAHRQQTGVAPDEGELTRLQNAELIANALRAVVALKRAGLLQDEGDLSAAAEAYRDAITQTVNALGPAFPLTGAYVALAQIERARGNYAAAEGPLATALADSQRKHNADSIAGLLAQMGALRREQGRYIEARQLSEDALKLARQVGQRSQLAGVLDALARVENELQDQVALKAAEAHLREALAIGRELNMRTSVPYTLSDLGLTLERAGRAREALAAYEEAVGLVEALSTTLSPDVSAEVFNTKRGNRDLYERLIKLLIKQGQPAAALGYLERAKSKSLVEALAGAQVAANTPALKQTLARLRAATAALRTAETALAPARAADGRTAPPRQAAQAQLARAQADYKTALATLRQANPDYASLVAVRAPDVNEIRRALPPRTLLIEYFPTDTTLYIFTLSHDAAPAVSAAPVTRAALAELVTQYRAAATVPAKSAAFARSTRGLSDDDAHDTVKQNVASMQEITGQLYALLFAPVQADVDRADTLLLVPAAELYYLPLHALGRVQPDGAVSYLIEQKRFAYLAAADAINTVAAVNGSAPATTNQALLALGNPDGSLPAATEEVKMLSRTFPQAVVYTGADATLAHVSAKPAQPVPYIHFATHGIINSREPKESFLLLAGKPGRLSVKDLIEDTYGMSFRGTRLVTLSACQTSIGGWDPSAVYSSLSRAFAKAGAPTVIASLWSVNDASTRDTMAIFYRELAAGQPKAEAMRRAQLAVLHNPRFAHPFFWAPFIVLGDWR